MINKTEVNQDFPKETFHIGDTVFASWSNGERTEGTLLHIPQDTGDMWHIRHSSGLMAINPSCSTLEGIVKEINEKEPN